MLALNASVIRGNGLESIGRVEYSAPGFNPPLGNHG